MLVREMRTGLAAAGVAAALALALATPGSAAEIGLVDFAFNVDGTVTAGGAPPEADLSAFDTATGLGTIGVRIVGAGPHFVGLFVDHEIDAMINGFTNEEGGDVEFPDAGLSWEVDEPGFGGGTGAYFGDIYDNLVSGALDGMVLVNLADGTAGMLPDDISLALGWDFALAAGEEALIRFIVAREGPSTPTPGVPFSLYQFDRDSDAFLGFWSTLDIRQVAVPEPTALALFAAGFAGLALARRLPQR